MRVSFHFEEALESLNQDVEYLSSYSSAVWSKDSPVVKELEQRKQDANAAVERASVVKHEHFLCLTLADPDNVKFADRLRQFTADLSSVLKRPWTAAAWPQLVAEVQQVSQSPAAAPGGQASSAAAAPSASASPGTKSEAPKTKKDKKDKKEKKEKKDKKKKGKSSGVPSES